MLVHLLTSEIHSRKQFLRYANPRIRLIIFQQHIVARLIGFNQTVLKVERLLLGVHHYIFQVVNVAHEHVGAKHRVNPIEIRAHPALQILRLAHVYYCALFIEVFIHAGAIGQKTNLEF